MSKVGIICEGTKQGADQQVLEHLARRILPGCEIEVVPLNKKPNLFAQCGTVAQALLDSGCRRILIVWDLLPAWGNELASEQTDRDAVRAALDAAGLGRHPCIFLVAIYRELETWLVSDGTALSAVIPVPPYSSKLSPIKTPENEANPKKWLMRKFQQIGRRPYLAEREAVKLAKAMPKDLRRIRRIPSFQNFEAGLQQPC